MRLTEFRYGQNSDPCSAPLNETIIVLMHLFLAATGESSSASKPSLFQRSDKGNDAKKSELQKKWKG